MAITVVAAYLSIQAVGNGSFVDGAGSCVCRLPAQHLDWTTFARSPVIVLWIVASLLKQVCTTNNLNDSNRFLYSKDSRNARKAALLAGILFLVGPVLWFIPPMAAAILFPDLSVVPELKSLGAKASEGSYVLMGMRYMPLGMIGLMVASIFAATTSSMEPGLNKNAGIFVMNFYKPILRKHASDREYLVAGKIASLVFGLLVIGAAVMIESIKFGLFELMMLFSSMVAIPFLVPLFWAIIIKRTPTWSAWSTVVVGLSVSFFTTKYLDPDLVRRFIGLSTPFTKREADDALFFTSLFLNVGISSLWFLGTALFARWNSPAVNAQQDEFFQRLNKPVLSDPYKTHAIDRAQLHTLGVLGIPYGGFMVLMAAIPNPLTGRLAFVLSGGAIMLVSLILYRAAKRMQVRPVAAASELQVQPIP
jgi:Na+/proline symporter